MITEADRQMREYGGVERVRPADHRQEAAGRRIHPITGCDTTERNHHRAPTHANIALQSTQRYIINSLKLSDEKKSLLNFHIFCD